MPRSRWRSAASSSWICAADGQLAKLAGGPATIDVKDGTASLSMTLPRQAVALVVVEW